MSKLFSAQSNPTTSHFRDQAKLERRLKHEQFVAIDDVPETRSSLKHLNNPMVCGILSKFSNNKILLLARHEPQYSRKERTEAKSFDVDD